jgi:hypothetical protein
MEHGALGEREYQNHLKLRAELRFREARSGNPRRRWKSISKFSRARKRGESLDEY